LHAVLLGSLFLPSTPLQAAAPPGAYWSHVARAVGELVEGHYTSAVYTLQRARNLRDQAELDVLVGLAALAGGEPKAASWQLARASKRGSSEPWVYYWAARAALIRGHLDAAARYITQAVAVGGDRPMLRIAQALVTHRLGKHLEAHQALLEVVARQPNLLDPSLYPTPQAGSVALLQSAMRRFPDRLLLWRTQGHLYWHLGQVLAARRMFERVLKLRNKDGDALQALARCSAAMGAAEHARQLAREALAAAPNLADAHATYGELLLQQGQPEKAIKQLQRGADAHDRDARMLVLLARACSEARRYDCAARYYRFAARRDPQSGAAQLGLALTLQQQGHDDKSAVVFERALATAPGDPRVYQGAAHLARLSGNRQRATALLRELPAAEAFQRRLRRLRARSQRQAAAMHQALQQCDCAGTHGCRAKSIACSEALHTLSTFARDVFKTHLKINNAPHAARSSIVSQDWTAHVLELLQRKRVLLSNPALTIVRGRTRAGRRYQVQRVLPLVPL